jgi:hypothetical protein
MLRSFKGETDRKSSVREKRKRAEHRWHHKSSCLSPCEEIYSHGTPLNQLIHNNESLNPLDHVFKVHTHLQGTVDFTFLLLLFSIFQVRYVYHFNHKCAANQWP